MKHRGFTIIELSAALVMLFVALCLFAQLVAATSESRTTQRMRTIAGEELRNVFERIGPELAADGTIDETELAELAAPIANSLPDGRLNWERIPCRIDADGRLAPAEGGTITAVRVSVSWDNGAKRPRPELAFVRLLFPNEKPEEQTRENPVESSAESLLGKPASPTGEQTEVVP